MFLNLFLPPLMFLAGGFFSFKTKFFFISHPISTLKFTFSGENTKKSLSSLILALAGTLGVGNIVGVAAGIAAGGPGAVFWLVVSSFFSSSVKYAEVSVSSNAGTSFGIIGVIEKTYKKCGKPIAALYASLAIILSLSMGMLLQGSAIRASFSADTPSCIFAIPILLLCSFIFARGGNRIKKAVAFSVPIAAICYTGMCFSVIIPNIDSLFSVLKLIISSAFSLGSFSGGILGFIVSSGIKDGFRVGLLSNEAGAGTSSFSHTSHKHQNACRAGCFGILEVVFDTLILCPLTAFTILLGGMNPSDGLSGISKLFYEYIGPASDILLPISVMAFALSTVFCWYYYGEVCLKYLSLEYFKIPYLLLSVSTLAISMLIDTDIGIVISDTVLLFLCIITLLTLFKNSKKITACNFYEKRNKTNIH